MALNHSLLVGSGFMNAGAGGGSGGAGGGGDEAQTVDDENYGDVSVEELYLVIGILSFLSVIGTAGNAVVLYVFAKKKDRLTSTVFILALAAVDFTTCLIVIPYTVYMEFTKFMIYYDILCKTYFFFITSNIPFSALIMVAIAIDRYFCICHPFLHAINLLRAKLIAAFLGGCAGCIGVVVALLYGVYTYQERPSSNSVVSNSSSASNSSSYLGVEDVTPLTVVATGAGTRPKTHDRILVYTGQCAPNEMYLSSGFLFYYQKFYTALYLVCLIIVIILYILIYRSVLSRRTKRQKEKSKAFPLVSSSQPTCQVDNNHEETLLTTVNGDTTVTTVTVRNGGNGNNSPSCGKSSPSAETPLDPQPHSPDKPEKKVKQKKTKEERKKEKARRKASKRDRNRIANLKTAAMLFVVTVVFILTFFPAFLMVLELMPYNMTIFYLYFANNVANPVIYSFMNKNFRDDLKRIFCRSR